MITTYGGFYVGRFEASKDTSTKASSKKYPFPLTEIPYYSAQLCAEGLCNTTSVKSGLLTGRMWDTTMRWFELETPGCSIDSRSWGNYRDSISPANTGNYVYDHVLNTGSNENWKKKNIYDMAGNVCEFTAEKVKNSLSDKIARGGVFGNCGLGSVNGYPAGSRMATSGSVTSDSVGFRVALYVL